jgi:RHS repeat-associated protein
VHEAGSFVPLAQATRQESVALTATADAKAVSETTGRYDINRDPLWNGEAEASTGPGFTKEEIAYYQCDHLGTPQELTDHQGDVAWSAQYKAWGQAKEVISDAARKAGFANPIRFQGQYLDEETGLHYNRYRYYDPHAGRFISSDPIGLHGGLNLHGYAPNPIDWVDQLGLSGSAAQRRKQRRAQERAAASSCPTAAGRTLPEYAPRIRQRAVQDPGGHNFPFSLDEAILSTTPVILRGGAEGYALRGCKNGKEVVYNMIVKDGQVTHRDMVAVDKWAQRSKSFGWPQKLEDIPWGH